MKDDKITITLRFNNHEHKLLLPLGDEEEEQTYRLAAELIKNTIRKYRNMAPNYSSENILELAILDISHKYVSLASCRNMLEQWGDDIDGCIENSESK